MILEGYIAKWQSYPKGERKVRVARPSILAPSLRLLSAYKEKLIDWHEYERRFINQIVNDKRAIERLREIAVESLERDVRLMCYEKNPPCHRFILLEMVKVLQSEA